MSEATFACPKCKTAINVEPAKDHLVVDCRSCASSLDASFFPAFFRMRQAGLAPAALVDQTEASCFYHPQKQAIRVCDGCGRLLCSLCSVELGMEHLCPSCISTGKKKGKLVSLEGSRTRYDSIAMSLAIFGAFIYFLAIFLAPAAIYISIRHWNSPGSVLGVSKKRFVVAIGLAVLELIVWFVMVGALIIGITRHA